MKVVLHTEDDRLVLRNALDLVSPLAGDLDAGLDCLRAGVHGQYHVKAEELGDELGETREDIVVEGARAEGQARGLFTESGNQLGMAVALVDSRVGGQEVQILATLRIPDTGALSTSKDDRQGVIVVSSVGMLELESLAGGSSVVGGHDFFLLSLSV